MSVWTLRAGAQCVSTEPYSHVASLAGCMYIHPDRGACSPAANSTHDDVDIFWRYSLYRALRNQTAISSLVQGGLRAASAATLENVTLHVCREFSRTTPWYLGDGRDTATWLTNVL